jgi:hypothetical protein
MISYLLTFGSGAAILAYAVYSIVAPAFATLSAVLG